MGRMQETEAAEPKQRQAGLPPCNYRQNPLQGAQGCLELGSDGLATSYTQSGEGSNLIL